MGSEIITRFSGSQATQSISFSEDYGASKAVNGQKAMQLSNEISCSDGHADPSQLFWMVQFTDPILITGVTIYNQFTAEGIGMYYVSTLSEQFFYITGY